MNRRLGPTAMAVALCVSGALTACGNGAGEGRAATGAVGPGVGRPGGSGPVPPSGEVVLVPLDGRGPSGTGTRAPSASLAPPGAPRTAGPPARGATTGPSVPPTPGTTATPGAPPTAPPQQPHEPHEPHEPQQPGTTAPPSATAPPRPAALAVGEPIRAPGDRRWCEKVTVEFRNTGGSPVRSGTATFATHVIGALGVDWATVETAQPLPAPIAAGATKTGTYTVCVDAWRVPLGMHIETRDVTASWT
ncbi:hypothetical protein AB0J57_11800 [Streptomyces sp. NPDC049837]|uniref:hypothetical protein n=1 Tax=Streptomyces sp. NPDC049837 TaxID=3155277 RepID=UPI00344174B9